jgi:ATP-dependent RNA helicase RhlE
MINTQKSAQSGFASLGIAPDLLEVLDRLKFIEPTPIQSQAIPVALEGKDVVGIAQTGTGKTLAFGLPVLQLLEKVKGQGMIILPTRELALQVDEALMKIAGRLGLKTAVLIGGASMQMQLRMLARKPHIIIATPGRLMDHVDRKSVSLRTVSILVLDEADRMFDIGFAPQIKKIIAGTSPERQMMLFSATMPKAIAELATRNMRLPIRIEVAPSGTTAAQIEQEIFIASPEIKMQLLEKVLNDNRGSVLIFSRTKHGAKKIALAIRQMGHTASEIHSNRSLAQRKMALAGFKSGVYRVLVATDIASRGIDVTGISLVINFDLPDQLEDYVHRIGRTGRAGQTGKAISFVAPFQRRDVMQIERLIKKTITVKQLPTLPPKRIVVGERMEFSPAPRRRAPQENFRPRKARPSFSRSQKSNFPRTYHGKR